MAEAVGLAAGVLGLAQVGWEVAKGLHDLADEISSAGEAVRIFANDFLLFVQTVQTLGDLIDDLPPVSRRTEATTEELLEVAMEQVVIPFRDMLGQLAPLLWAFKHKDRVLFYHSALNALKGNVSLLLQALTLRGQNPRHVQFIICASIEDTKSMLPGGSRQQASRLLDGTNVGALEATSTMQTSGTASRPRSLLSQSPARAGCDELDSHRQSTAGALVRVVNVDDTDENDEVTEFLAGIKILELDYMQTTDQERRESEERLEAYGAIRAIQKKVIRVADEELAAMTSASTQPAGETRSHDLSSTGGVERSASSRPPGAVAPENEAISMQRQEQTEAHTSQGVAAPTINTKSKSTEEESDPIDFVDGIGTRFSIPFNLVRTWPAMQAFIVAEYAQIEDIDLHYYSQSHLPRLKQEIQRGTYTIVKEDGRLIAPYEWEARVTPGCSLHLVMDDERLRECTAPDRNVSFRTIRLAQTAAAEHGATSRGRSLGEGLSLFSIGAEPKIAGDSKRSRSSLRSKFGLT